MDARMGPGWSTLAAALRAALAAAGDPRTLTDVLGYGGGAFRIVVGRGLEMGGWHASAWLHEIPGMVWRLGWRAELVYAAPGDDRMGALRRGLATLRASLAAGRPALLYGVHLGEWGLVVGQDGRDLLVSGILDGRGGATRMADSDAGEGDVPVLCVVVLHERVAVAPGAAVTAALRAAVGHLRGATLTDRGHDAGLAAWASVEEALESGRFDPPGLAWTLQLLAEARAAAPAWLNAVREHAPAARAELERAARAWGRSAEALADAAARAPFPPAGTGPGLTTSVIDQILARVREAAMAEVEGTRALEAALAAQDRAASDAVVLRDLGGTQGLFACVRDLPLGGLEAAAHACRSAVHGGMRAKVADGGGAGIVGHVYSSLLSEARAPLLAPVGTPPERVVVLHCPWVDRRLRGRGLGRRLIEAVIADARAAGAAGIAMIATGEDQFLSDAPMKHLGWSEVDRRHDDDARLLWLPLAARPGAPAPAFAPPAPAAPPPGHLVVIRHAYHCPLLLLARQGVAAAARDAGAPLDEAEARAAGGAHGARVLIAGHDLPWGYVPPEAAGRIIAEAQRE